MLRHDWTVAEIEAADTAPPPDSIFRTQTIHRAHHRADEVQGCMLLCIKTGGCPEDCTCCPQSAHYQTGVARTDLVSLDELTAAATSAREQLTMPNPGQTHDDRLLARLGMRLAPQPVTANAG